MGDKNETETDQILIDVEDLIDWIAEARCQLGKSSHHGLDIVSAYLRGAKLGAQSPRRGNALESKSR